MPDMAHPKWLPPESCVLLLVLALTPIAAHAGGLAMAPLIGIASMVYMLTCWRTSHIRPFFAHLPLWSLLLGLFLGWAALSALWSPFQTTQILPNAVKLLIFIPLFCVFFYAFVHSYHQIPKVIADCILIITICLSLSLLIDLVSHYRISFLFDPPRHGDNLLTKADDTQRNISHGVSILTLLYFPTASILFKRYKYGAFYAVSLWLICLIIAGLSQLAAAQYSLVLGLLIASIAYVWPMFTRLFISISLPLSILGAPLFTWITLALKPGQYNLPPTWEHRLYMWQAAYDKILQKPVSGHGLDATRNFTKTITLSDQSQPTLMPIHPHNMGIHVWLECGFIGALLASLFAYTAWQSLGVHARRHKQITALFCAQASVIILQYSVSYGAWRLWWWASVILSSACIYITIKWWPNQPSRPA